MDLSPFWSFEHLYFEFVSYFDLRLSDLQKIRAAQPFDETRNLMA